jgi:3,4-dihydroxy 2-butanone 4-phosphate synthase / GTP cyclohydrolase II
MAGDAELAHFADEYGLAMVSIDDLVAYRRRTEPQVVRLAETMLATNAGASRVIGFRDVHDGGDHLVVIVGAPGPGVPMPLHVHVECLTGDVFGSTACRCGGELDSALTTMTARGSGMVVYLRPSGPVRACGLFGRGEEAPAERVSATVKWILRDLGVHAVRLSDDTPGFGLVMLGAIREHGLHAADRSLALAVAG